MTPREALVKLVAIIKTTLPVFTDRGDLFPTDSTQPSQPVPALFALVDPIYDSPVGAYDGESGSFKLFQVTIWAKGSRGPAYDAGEVVKAALIAQGYRRLGNSGYPEEDTYKGVRMDFRIH